jgi:alkaline phosphatase D
MNQKRCNNIKNMARVNVFVFFLIVALSICSCKKSEVVNNPNELRLAFGSCGHEDAPQPILALAAEQQPDAFIFLGDNIYGDTYSMDTLQRKYQMLADKAEYKKLKATTTLYATWDDHDFGWNDAGRHYPFKTESKELFLRFFGDQGDTAIRQHEGIYHTVYLNKLGKRVQIIFPDLRTFRDDLLPYNGNHANDKRFDYEMDYSPYTITDSTLLGEEQWKWMEEQLRQPADLRIIASSSQFGITHNGYEAWANFPHERQRMIDLIKTTQAEGVLFISGDVHYAEVSKLEAPGVYPLFDITSSGITSTWQFATPNDNRIEEPVMENHFGVLLIDFSTEDPLITIRIIDKSNTVRINRTIKRSELVFAKQ